MRYIIIASLLLFSTPAFAKHHKHPFREYTSRHYHHAHYGARFATRHRYTHTDGRPSAWCGWYMRQIMHVADAAFNLARNWAHYGSPTTPHIGAIVVWPHHVGRIVGGSEGHWVINSGNDGHVVRTRERSVAGAIAFRS